MNPEEHKRQLYEQLKLQQWGNMSIEERKEQSRRELKAHLQYIDLLKLQKKIDQFRKLNFKNLSYQEVGKAVHDVVFFDTFRGKSCILPISGCPSYPAGTRFYRVRSIPRDDRKLPLKFMSKVSDCWEPPKEIVDIGRLNKAHEPLLYTTPGHPMTAVEELKISENEFFSLIEYEATQKINVAMIGGNFEYDGLNSDERLKLQMIQDFFCHEFIRDVGKGTEYLYRISEYIAKTFFDFPAEVQDAWCYPSITKKENYNVCFRPKKRKEKLKLIGVQIASIRTINKEKVFYIPLVVKESPDGHNLSYFGIGSSEQKEMFPEIQF